MNFLYRPLFAKLQAGLWRGVNESKDMRSVIARAAVLCAGFCIHQAATAQDALHFWTASGEHGISACVFETDPRDAGHKRTGELVFGVSADPHQPQLMGKVRLRQDGLAPGAHLLEIGDGPRTLLSATLDSKNGSALADAPGAAMADILRSVAPHARLWMRIGDATGRPQQIMLRVTGREDEVSSCLAILERDLATFRNEPAGTIQVVYSPVLFSW